MCVRHLRERKKKHKLYREILPVSGLNFRGAFVLVAFAEATLLQRGTVTTTLPIPSYPALLLQDITLRGTPTAGVNILCKMFRNNNEQQQQQKQKQQKHQKQQQRRQQQ